MNESATVFCASEGVGIILRKSDEAEKISPFSYCGDDALMTKAVSTGFKFSSNVKKCVVKSIGTSSAIVVFGTSEERKKILDASSNGIKNYHQHFNQQMQLKNLADLVGNEMNKLYHTSQCSAEVILTSWDMQSGAQAFAIDSSGDRFAYQVCAIGGDKNRLKFKLSKIFFQNLSTNQGLVESLKVLMDESNGCFDFEVIRICSDTQGLYEPGSEEFCKEILKEAMRN